MTTEHEAYEIARDAYVYAYPLILHHATRAQLTNFAEPTGILAQGPHNQLSHSAAFPPSDYRGIVRPNLDTLYSTAWLDLEPEPLVLSVPAIDRYFLLQLSDAWTDVFASPGTRTTGRNTAREFLLAGPRWQDDVPAGLSLLRCPTRFAAIGGRIQTNGAADYEAVHRLQQEFRLTPLSMRGRGSRAPSLGIVDPAIDMATPPPLQVARLDAAAFFGWFGELLEDNPPGPCDYPMLHRLERVGFEVGRRFDVAALPAGLRAAFERATVDGRALIERLARQAAGEGARDWTYSTSGGAFGVDYAYRAAVASYALGMNLPEDAIYPSLATDSERRPLDGSGGNRYVLRFERSRLPPVNAFWSVTAYDADGYLAPNAIDRHALGDRDRLVAGSDGSVSLYLQATSPGREREPSWLPVPKGPFTLLMRLYWPKREALDRTWTPPPVLRQ